MKSQRLQSLPVLVVLFSLFSWVAVHAQITPLGDAYTNSADPTTNYGSKTLLDVDGATQITYIQFNLASIPSGATVSQATLKLYVNGVTTAGSFNVDYVNGAWTEGTLTYDKAPALGTTIASDVAITTADKNQYILINVTSAVQAWLSGSQSNDGIALVANSTFNATFDSKENTTTSHPAELDIAYAGGDGTITGVTTASGSGLTGGGTSGTLNLSLTNACAASQVLQWNGTAWACSNAGTGTITGVTAGTDLTGGGSSGNVTLNLNTTALNSSYAQLAAANSFTGNQTVNGNLSTGPIIATASSGIAAVIGNDTSSGGAAGGAVYGNSTNGTGVSGNGGTYAYGVSGNGGTGVYGNGGTGVYGNGSGYYGVAGSGPTGVYGYSQGSVSGQNGVEGVVSGAAGSGVAGFNNSSGTGVYGQGYVGVYGYGTYGVEGYGSSYGVLSGVGAGGWAGWFNGNVEVDGNLSKGGGSFKIDHPLDPANKYLYHSFVESPDMKNIYDGVVTLDGSGAAVVTLPEWFETLNRDFRYQLTCIGSFAPVYVAQKVQNNSFKISGGQPGMEVSWQVTGIRQDAWANAHRIPVDQEKPEVERGFYLHPELYGAPEEKGVLWATAPEAMKQWKEARTKAATSDGNEVLTNPGKGRPQPLPMPLGPRSSSMKGPS